MTHINEFDRVAGGGLVPGSALLVGGDPGVGKSTLVLQALAAFASRKGTAVYISGEEALAQVRLRAARMDLAKAPVQLGSATCIEDILTTLAGAPPPGILAIDSIQTIWTSALDAAPGTIAQVRTATHDLVRYAKASGAALILVGHVTKDGQIAGPKAVEHLVDAVLYFEGERGHHFRILRAVKNRFGATDEIGVFEMTGKGLAEVANPSALFLGDRSGLAPGAAVFAGIEGTRPLLVEVQALVAATSYGSPRRAVVGWDTGRLSMILAVLDARAGLGIGPGCLSQRGRRIEDRRAGGGSGGGGGADFLLHRPALAQGLRGVRRDQPFGRRAPRPAGRAAPQGSRKTGLQAGAGAGRHQGRGRRVGASADRECPGFGRNAGAAEAISRNVVESDHG